jgi:hypothetical protein
MSIAHSSAPDKSLTRRDFLSALYHGAPDDLYIELRCIHPTTGDARSFWSRIGDKRSLTNAFRRAEDLNRTGYGCYFAPCPRNGRSGKADAAALLPALWVDLDCDDDPVRRAAALARLHSFDPLPSAIIDSGGGLHAYWLLCEPVMLADDAARIRAASILRGLFSALGGDPGYVKSVASVMRMPESINTKPERGGVVVTLLELHPERRFPLEAFAWLETKPIPAQVPIKSIKVALNGHHPLPKQTQDYLAFGAPEGSRNAQLFAAACQLRDAGYSQAEAEGQLVARHSADGSSETEARKTIASAYSQPARDPVTSPRAQVTQLVSRFNKQAETQDRPSADQIAETVRACATLDPVSWAEARQQLKSVCGDGLKLTDLDSLYREARRKHTRSFDRPTEQAERYVERDDGMVYEKESDRGITRQIVADWTGHIVEWLTQVDDDGQVERQTRLQLVHPSITMTIDVPDELFGDPNGLARLIAGKAGSMFAPRAGMQKHLASAILKLSGDAPRRQTYRFIGWTRIDDQLAFVSPGLCVGGQGALGSQPEVALEHRLRDYGLSDSTWEQGLDAFHAAIGVFPPELASILIAYALLPLVQRFFPAAVPKPALHLVGTTGSGKSEIAALMASFYGRFTRDTPPAQWGDTVNTVEALGYTLADALYWVDDYKAIYADERTFTRFLQSYSRGMGRGRLNRDSSVRQERPCRGHLLSTGETTIEGEASILSRMIVLEVPPWERRDPTGRLLDQAEGLRRHLPGFTAAFVRWLAQRDESGTFTSELADYFESHVEDYRARVQAQLGRQAHTGRMIDNWSLLATVYQLLNAFLEDQGVDDAPLPPWRDGIVQAVSAVQQERAGQVFLDLLGQLLAGGQCVIDDDLRHPRDYAPGVTVVGYREDDTVYLLPDLALREINRMHPLRFSVTAIGMQLREDGILIPGPNNLSIQKRVRGSRVRFWQLNSDSLVESVEPPETVSS